MENYLMNRLFLYIFLLIFLVSFLVFPKFCLANNFDEITSKEIEKYLELSEQDAQNLLFTLKQVFTTDWIYRESSGFSTEEESLVPLILRKVIRINALNHLLIDAPIEVTQKIIKGAIDIVRIYYDPSVFWEKFEKLTVEKAVAEAKKQLFQKEIRVTPGAIEFRYISQKGEERKVIFQYLLIYHPIDNTYGKVAIRFYSPTPLVPPKPEGSIGNIRGTPHSLQKDLPPFIVEITGNVEKGKLNNYSWIREPSVKIDFPPEVPDLGIKPLSFWERHLLKPLKTTIKEVEVIITKVTGKAPKIVERASEIWNEIKSTISKFIPVSPAALVTPLEVSEVKEEQSLTVKETKEKIIEFPEDGSRETGEQPGEVAEVGYLQPQLKFKSNKERLAEIQETLDDIAERIDVLSQQLAKLAEEKGVRLVDEKIGKEKEEEIKEESEELEEMAEEKETEIKKEVCQPNSININTASKEELEKIIGIGSVLAQRIIEARPFSSLNDLLRVKGIGEKTLQNIIAQGCAYVERFYFAGGGFSPPPPPSYPEILISEIQIWDAASSDHDFIELYNPNSDEVDISGWQLKKRNSYGNESSIRVFPSRSIIPTQSYFLWANSTYASSTGANATSSQTLAKDNSIALLDPNKNIVDALVWGSSTNPFLEGFPFPQNPEKGKSLGRKWSTTTQSYIDTDNNAQDFELQTPTPKFQNQSAENRLPTANFIYTPENPIVDQVIIFDASSSTDDGTITNYIWDFGDGNSTTTSSPTTTHSYSISSDFIVTLLVIDNLDATSSPVTTTINITQPPTLSIVINEIAWMGTKASDWDEWIELYNNTSSTIDLLNWKLTLTQGTTTREIIISTLSAATTTISANGFYLLERAEKAIDIPADLVYGGERISNNGAKLELRDANGNLIDLVDFSSGWPAGEASPNYISMERISATTTGATSTNWANNNLITRNGLDANGDPINGTPKSPNSVSKSETIISNLPPTEFVNLPFDEFSELTLTKLGSPYVIGDYRYGSTLIIPPGKTLNIEPGVTLKFIAPNILFPRPSLVVNGTLKAVGQESKEITFIRYEKSLGYKWTGIYFSPTSQNSILEYVRIEDVRGPVSSWLNPNEYYVIKIEESKVDFKNLTLENNDSLRGIWLVNSSSTVEAARISGFNNSLSDLPPTAIHIEGGNPIIQNSTFKNNSYAIKIEKDAKPLITGNVFEENEAPVYLKGDSPLTPAPTFSNNQAVSNTYNGILIRGAFSQDLTWQLDLPYIIDYYLEIASSTVLTIQPGVVVKMKSAHPRFSGYEAYVQIFGSLIAEGTESQPIVFTSLYDDYYGGDTNNDATNTSPHYWDWKEITFMPGSTGSLKHVILRYGGGGYIPDPPYRRNKPLVIEEGVSVFQEEVSFEFSSPPENE